MTGRKTAFFVSPDLEDDVFIPTANLNHALDKDIVKVYVYNRRKGKVLKEKLLKKGHKTDL
jgi:ribonuclease R